MKRILNKLLVLAVQTDNVKIAYYLLKIGADVNHKIVELDYLGNTCHKSPLSIAKSDAMRRLLWHFGAKDLYSLTVKWKEEESQEQERKKALEKSRIDLKQKKDSDFLDSVL